MLTQGALSNYKDSLGSGDEPDDHAIGRSRGGLTTKTHALVDGQALSVLLSQLRIPRLGCGRPRLTPDALLADKAYSAKAHRDALRARGVKVVIPEKTDQQTNHKNPGSKGGRPVGFDAEAYKGRNVVERAFNKLKDWRGLATRYDKHALIYRGGMVLASIVLWLKA